MNTQPNSWPTLEPGSHRWCEAPDSKPRVEQCSWSSGTLPVPRISEYSAGVICGPVGRPWCCHLHVLQDTSPDDIDLSCTNGSKQALNSGAAWRLNLQPQPNRRTS